MPAATIGAVKAFRNDSFQRARWLGMFPVIVFVLLIGFNIKETKLFGAAYFFLCILAGLGCYTIKTEIDRIRSDFIRILSSVFGILAISFFFINSVLLIVFFLSPISFETDLLKAGNVMTSHSADTNPMVLCDTQAGRLLPVISGVRVYAGHPSMTPDYPGKKKRLASAGFQSSNESPQQGDRFPSFLQLLRSAPFEFVLVKKDHIAYSFCREAKDLQLLQCYDRRCVFVRSSFRNAFIR